MGMTLEGGVTGLIHADEEELEIPIASLMLPCGETLTFSLERLQIEPQGTFRDRDYRFEQSWVPETSALCEWNREKATLRISGLETGLVYRVNGLIGGTDDQVYPYLNLVTLSKSVYEKGAFEILGPENNGKTVARRVYHPFDKRNWVPAAYLSSERTTGSSGDEASDHQALQAIAVAIRRQMSLKDTQQYILELPEGTLNMGVQTFNFTPGFVHSSISRRLLVHGRGPERTRLADLALRPVASKTGHFFFFTDRISFHNFQDLELRDFSLWGAVPGEQQVMEVSGRPIPVEGQLPSEPYRWFARGMGISDCLDTRLSNLDFRFHSIGLLLERTHARISGEPTDISLQDLTFSYGDSGILVRDAIFPRIGPNVDIHHVSRQGIFGNRVREAVIEGVTIDGARHRGINLDQSSRIRIQNNDIRNSGQSAIHLGGDVHQITVTGNTIRTVNRDRPNPFGDQNSEDGTILSYRPLYEGIKSVRGQWGDSDRLLISDNDISDVANGIAIIQGNASDILIEKNTISAYQRGIRLEYGKARLLVDDGIAFEGFLRNLFVMPDNQIELTEPISVDDDLRHGILFPDADPNCPGCNIGLLDSYGEDLGKDIALYPFPIEFFSYDACGDTPSESCREWLSNEEVSNPGPVYLPTLGNEVYRHPMAPSITIDAAAMARAEQVRQAILEFLP